VVTNPTTTSTDGWAFFQTEWRDLRSFVENHGIAGVVFIAGDLMRGIDNGSLRIPRDGGPSA
jgi:hypothetical protein